MTYEELANASPEEIKAYIEECHADQTGVDARFGDEAAGNTIILALCERLLRQS